MVRKTKPLLLVIIGLFIGFLFMQNALPIIHAISDEQRRLFNSGVRDYDIDVSGRISYNCVLDGNNNAEKAWNFLIGQGLTAEQAAGVLGNLEAEAAGINPTLQELVSGISTREEAWRQERGGWGIAQWTGMSASGPAGVRRLNIKNAVIDSLGPEYYTMDALPDNLDEELLLFQLNYMVEESINRSVRPQSHPEIDQPFSADNEWEGLQLMRTVEEATYYWEWNYERAGIPRIQARLGFAQNFYNEFSSLGSSQGSCAPLSLGDIECPANLEAHPTEPGYFRMPTAPNNEYNVYSPSSRRWGGQELICVIHSVSIAYKEIYGSRSTVQVGSLNTPLGQPSQTHQYGVAVDLLANGEVCAGAWVGSNCTQSRYSEEATITLGSLFVDSAMIKNIWWCPPDATAHRASTGASQVALRNHAESVGQPLNINCQWQNRSSNGHADHFHIDLLDEFRVHDDQRYSSPSSGLFVD